MRGGSHQPGLVAGSPVCRGGHGYCGVGDDGQTIHVNLRDGSRPFPTTQRGLIRDGLVFTTEGGLIEVYWKDATHLVINPDVPCPSAETKSWQDVTLSYGVTPIPVRHQTTGELLLQTPRLLRAELRSASLAGANLEGQNVSFADLRNANLHSANLEGARLFHSDLRRADLRAANLRNANLAGSDFGGASLRGADLSRAILDDADLRTADLTGANLRGARYSGWKESNGADPGTKWPKGFDPRKRGAVLMRQGQDGREVVP